MEQQCECIDDVKDFVMKSKTRLQKILDRLNWSEAGVLKNFNNNCVASSTCHKPKKICSPKIITYPESLVTTNSLTIETQELQQLLKSEQIEAPQNFRELQANFSREQKLQIYEHVIGHTQKLETDTVPKVADGEISLTEIFAQKKREEKRRKRKFRKSKPTHIEEVRSLVDLQMQALLQFIENQQEKTEERITKDRYHRLRERSRSRDHHRRRYKNDSQRSPSQQRIESRRRSRERTNDSRRRSRNYSKDGSTKKRSHSRSYDHRKKSRSKESRSKKESYQRNRYRSPTPNRKIDYENYYRRESISPQATSSRHDRSKDRHHHSSSSYTRSVYDTDYEDARKKYKQDSNRAEEAIRRDKEKYYSRHERVDKYKEHNVYSRHRSEERNEQRSKHKRKKHKKDHS